MKKILILNIISFLFVIFLCSCSDDVDKIPKDSLLQQTPLMAASAAGDVEKVKKLVKKGAKIDYRDILNQTALMLASYRGYYEVASILLQSGAYSNATDIKGQTPIILAASKGDIRMVQLLLRYGADATSKDKWHRSAWSELTRIYDNDYAKKVLGGY